MFHRPRRASNHGGGRRKAFGHAQHRGADDAVHRLLFHTRGSLFNTHRFLFNTHRFRFNSLFRGARGLSLLCCAFRRSAGISTTASQPKWPSTSSSPQDQSALNPRAATRMYRSACRRHSAYRSARGRPIRPCAARKTGHSLHSFGPFRSRREHYSADAEGLLSCSPAEDGTRR